MEEWVRVLRRVTGVPNGGLVKLHVLKEPQEMQFTFRHLGDFP